MCKGTIKQSPETYVNNKVIEGDDDSDHSSGLTIFSFHGSEIIFIVGITIVVIFAILFLCFIYNRTRALCWLCLHHNVSQKQKIKVMGKTLPSVNTINHINSMEVMNSLNNIREASKDNQLTAKNMEWTINSETLRDFIHIINKFDEAKNNK